MDAIDLVQYFLFVYLNKELIHWQNVVNCNHQRALQLTLCQAWCEHSALVFVYNKMTHYVESLLKCIQMFHLHSSTFLQKVSNGTDGSKKGVNLVFKSISLSGLTPYFGPLCPPTPPIRYLRISVHVQIHVGVRQNNLILGQGFGKGQYTFSSDKLSRFAKKQTSSGKKTNFHNRNSLLGKSFPLTPPNPQI